MNNHQYDNTYKLLDIFLSIVLIWHYRNKTEYNLIVLCSYKHYVDPLFKSKNWQLSFFYLHSGFVFTFSFIFFICVECLDMRRNCYSQKYSQCVLIVYAGGFKEELYKHVNQQSLQFSFNALWPFITTTLQDYKLFVYAFDKHYILMLFKWKFLGKLLNNKQSEKVICVKWLDCFQDFFFFALLYTIHLIRQVLSKGTLHQ